MSKQKTGKSKSRGRMFVHYFGLQGSRPKVTNGAFKKGKSTKSTNQKRKANKKRNGNK